MTHRQPDDARPRTSGLFALPDVAPATGMTFSTAGRRRRPGEEPALVPCLNPYGCCLMFLMRLFFVLGERG